MKITVPLLSKADYDFTVSGNTPAIDLTEVVRISALIRFTSLTGTNVVFTFQYQDPTGSWVDIGGSATVSAPGLTIMHWGPGVSGGTVVNNFNLPTSIRIRWVPTSVSAHVSSVSITGSKA